MPKTHQKRKHNTDTVDSRTPSLKQKRRTIPTQKQALNDEDELQRAIAKQKRTLEQLTKRTTQLRAELKSAPAQPPREHDRELGLESEENNDATSIKIASSVSGYNPYCIALSSSSVYRGFDGTCQTYEKTTALETCGVRTNTGIYTDTPPAAHSNPSPGFSTFTGPICWISS